MLIAEYRREQDIARDYEGREILELLQNANDQAVERGERGRVLIELSQDGLIVSNTGLAFSVGGVGSLQTSHLRRSFRRPTDYEIVVAVPRDNTPTAGILYSHFPTDIILPLPVVCHATLELEQNRKHAQQKRACNEYVFAKLAEVLAEIAESEAATSVDDPWAGCSLLMPAGGAGNLSVTRASAFGRYSTGRVRRLF